MENQGVGWQPMLPEHTPMHKNSIPTTAYAPFEHPPMLSEHPEKMMKTFLNVLPYHTAMLPERTVTPVLQESLRAASPQTNEHLEEK